MWQFISNVILRNRFFFIGLITVFTILFAYSAFTKLELENKYGIVLPQNSDTSKDYESFKSKFGEERYFKIAERIYYELDRRLSFSKYLADNDYSIADIATFPWIARHEWHDIGLKRFNHLAKWYNKISERDAVKRGYDLLQNNEKIPKV